jgi:choline dehydrogenase-like flavoprotein
LSQGKALGGSSVINAQVFVPPGKSLIDAWESLGNEGWNWDALKPYFAKSYTSPAVNETMEIALGIDGWSAKNDAARGPVQTSFPGNPSHPIRKAWAEAFKTNGNSIAEDPFLNSSVGGFSCLASVDPLTKERSHATSAYYSPIKDRENLHVLTGALVEKIIFKDGHSQTATGVQYRRNNETITVTCIKEVLVTAGALQSPKILQLSGIGDANLLKTHDIKIIEDLPAVGQNLQDHLFTMLDFEAVDGLETLDCLMRQEPEALQQAMEQYATSQTGLFTSVGLTTCAYLPLIDYLSEDDQHLLKTLLNDNGPDMGHSPAESRSWAYYEVAQKALLDPKQPSAALFSLLCQDPKFEFQGASYAEGTYVSIGLIHSNPFSRGSVKIRSNEASDAPVIDPGYLSNPIDVEVMARHLLNLENIAASSSFRPILKQPPRRPDSAVLITDLESSKKHIRENAISMWHLVGTCAMLPRDKGGVVDTELSVYGVKNLRVVDASAIPLISTANSQSTVYALAERAADLVKMTWSLS